jgi:hypothetical protein
MRQRCTNRNNKRYKHYGARGVHVCQAWNDFGVFYTWAMANGYRPGLTLDRKRTNGNYCPSNCRFASFSQQAQSRRKRPGRSSRFIGASFRKEHGDYVAYVKLLGQQRVLGYFPTEETAAVARDTYVREHYDEFATLNEVA